LPTPPLVFPTVTITASLRFGSAAKRYTTAL
jgi:hypothetical protein